MLKIKESVDLKELEKFGFKNNQYIRTLNDSLLYRVVITSTHHYLQIRDCCFSNIAGSLQDLIYDLIQADLVEKVDKWLFIGIQH